MKWWKKLLIYIVFHNWPDRYSASRDAVIIYFRKRFW